MKIILNLSTLSPPMTGIGQYVYRLLVELLQNPQITEVCGFVRLRYLRDKQEVLHYLSTLQSASVAPSAYTKRYADLRKYLVNFVSVRWAYYHLRDMLLRKKLNQDFIYWDGAYTPVAFSGKMMITVYDLSHIRHSQWHPASRVAIMNAYLPKAIEQSTHILTISEFSKQEIMELLNVPSSKISILPPSTSEYFQPLEYPQCQVTLEYYKLEWKKYILSVATLEPRKNLDHLLKAYLKLSKEIRKEYTLVFVGGLGWSHDELYHQLCELQKQGEIRLLGYVSDHLLPMIYAGAKCFAYVSLYEGYGMPIAEALRSGIPCVTSARGAMMEVGGSEAIYVDPLCVEDIQRGLQEGLDSKQLITGRHESILSPNEAAQRFFKILQKIENI